jgi:hypothetical protein
MNTTSHTPVPLILHGHFYQPPRENPLVNIIPQQHSAKPYSDWNEKVYDDCYRANAFSRYLDGYGHIRDIVNNYAYISYNFGPTLLQWIEKYHIGTYRRILEADALSLERLGHGNAMAQAYNHTILPLAHERDARTQIMWGIADFVHRFHRQPEGMWLPETAINPMVVDLLAEQGITFVILSPWQCAQVEDEKGTWHSVKGNEVPFDRAYLISGERGNTVSAFFYHPELASSISFGHMLRDADAMYQALRDITKKHHPNLLHTATDGEIYGHHEPFGDMALAALIRKVRDDSTFSLTNYATYLAQNPAQQQAILHAGEEQKGTSWSCSHGVSRWYKDCGCHTGGEDEWNQKWRTPLRDAFTQLGDTVDTLFDTHISELFSQTVNPDELLHDYVRVLTKSETLQQFISRWEEKSGVTISDHRKFAELLEGQRYKHYMFTSCGWFFSDLGGIEPRQNLHYAVRTCDLYQPHTDNQMLDSIMSILRQAKSNRRHEGSGATIAKSYVQMISGEAEAGAYFLMNQRFARPEDYQNTYGKFRLTAYSAPEEDHAIIELIDTSIEKRSVLDVQVETMPGNGYIATMTITDTDRDLSISGKFSTADIPVRMLDEVYTWIDHSLSRISDEELKRIATDIRHYSLLVKNSRSAPSETLYIENMGTCLRALRSIFSTPDTLPWEHKRESISFLLAFIRRKGRQHEIGIVQDIFTQEIARVAVLIHARGFTYERASYLLEVLNVAREQDIHPTITQAQEALYPYVKGEHRQDYTTPLTTQVLDALQVALNFSID